MDAGAWGLVITLMWGLTSHPFVPLLGFWMQRSLLPNRPHPSCPPHHHSPPPHTTTHHYHMQKSLLPEEVERVMHAPHAALVVLGELGRCLRSCRAHPMGRCVPCLAAGCAAACSMGCAPKTNGLQGTWGGCLSICVYEGLHTRTPTPPHIHAPHRQCLDANVTALCDALGGCERIFKTPIPLTCGWGPCSQRPAPRHPVPHYCRKPRATNAAMH